MNLAFIRKLLQHDDLHQSLKHIRDNGQKTLITIHHDMEEIHRVLERVKKDGEHHWWEVLFGWSPTATGIFNSVLHPVIVVLGLVLLCLVLTVIYKDVALAETSVPT
uniref:Env n=1 Tax=Bonasa umbellus TaxID=9000 RepID=Q98U09_BONUM|nr:env [Bonasa umbellus]